MNYPPASSTHLAKRLKPSVDSYTDFNLRTIVGVSQSQPPHLYAPSEINFITIEYQEWQQKRINIINRLKKDGVKNPELAAMEAERILSIFVKLHHNSISGDFMFDGDEFAFFATKYQLTRAQHISSIIQIKAKNNPAFSLDLIPPDYRVILPQPLNAEQINNLASGIKEAFNYFCSHLVPYYIKRDIVALRISRYLR